MKSLYIVFLAAAAILFSSCGSSETDSASKVKTLDIAGAITGHQVAKLSDFCSNLEYIKLETTASSLLNGRERVSIIGNDIFFWDYIVGNSYCYVFGPDGSFKGKVGEQGNGPNEYLRIEGIAADPGKNEIYIKSGNKVMVYDYNTYALKETFPIGRNIPGMTYFLQDFTYFANNFILSGTHYFTDNPTAFFMDRSDKILFIDSLSHLEYGADPAAEPVIGKAKNNYFAYHYNDTLTVGNRLSDTLYGYGPNLGKTPRYVIETGKYKLKKDKSNYNECLCLSGNNIFENKSLALFLTIFQHNDRAKYIPVGNGAARLIVTGYNKSTGKTFMLDYFPELNFCAFENDIDGGAPFKVTGTGYDKMYQIIDAITFMDLAEKSKSQKMKEVAATLTEESNPVIVTATLK